MKKKKGFTLIELLIVIGIIAILAAIIYVAVDPGKRLKQARDADRWSSANSILNAVLKYAVDNQGQLPTGIGATATVLGTATANANCVCSGGGGTENCLDLSGDLVDTYLSEIPCDDASANAQCDPAAPTITRYAISRSASGRITVEACDPELEPAISVTR